MRIVTINYDGSNEEMIRIINEQTEQNMRLTTIQNVEAGNFLSFAPKEYLTPDEKIEATMKNLSTTQSELSQTQEELAGTQIALVETYEQLVKSEEEATSTQLALADMYEHLLTLEAQVNS